MTNTGMNSRDLLANTAAAAVVDQPLKHYLPQLQEAIYDYIELLLEGTEENSSSTMAATSGRICLSVEPVTRGEKAVLTLLGSKPTTDMADLLVQYMDVWSDTQPLHNAVTRLLDLGFVGRTNQGCSGRYFLTMLGRQYQVEEEKQMQESM